MHTAQTEVKVTVGSADVKERDKIAQLSALMYRQRPVLARVLHSLHPLISGFRAFKGSDMKGSSEIDRGFRFRG